MLNSIEIAQQTPLKPIQNYLEELQLSQDDFEGYGTYTGKIKLDVLDRSETRTPGKLILVTAMTPTPSGEGKTLTTIGVGQALKKLGKRGLISLRQPSMGPVFGIKGGATGGGYAQVLPMERINLHFNGDIHAVSTAHNLLAAMIDNHLYQGNLLRLDPTTILWPRTLDMNDRALRQIIVGLGGKSNGVPRESGFVITAASEVMAILALAHSRLNLKERLSEIVVGFNTDGKIIKSSDLKASGAMAATLQEAILPNLVQTLEQTPALIHAGPFANIAHGASSILSIQIARKLADYVVTECGFGADLGAEKFFHIVCRQGNFWPSVVVVVATCRALKYHGGVSLASLTQENLSALQKGFLNLSAHLHNLQQFKVPVIVALNQFTSDTHSEIGQVIELCRNIGIACVPHNAFSQGGNGALELASEVIGQANTLSEPQPQFLYELNQSLEEKIQILATRIYGADGVSYEKRAWKQLEKWTRLGYGNLPICIAKTQSSLSDNPKALGAPKGWKLQISEIRLSAGAGFIVVVCGEMMLLPGLPEIPTATHIDIDERGRIRGLF
ncbi:MAG: formate--tetrahydrofolate ligase [Planctomycetota bacterium]